MSNLWLPDSPKDEKQTPKEQNRQVFDFRDCEIDQKNGAPAFIISFGFLIFALDHVLVYIYFFVQFLVVQPS